MIRIRQTGREPRAVNRGTPTTNHLTIMTTATVNLTVHTHGGTVTPEVKVFDNFVSVEMKTEDGHAVDYFFDNVEDVRQFANRLLGALQDRKVASHV